jgi:hypothetical protein
MTEFPEGLEPVDDLAPAAWVAAALPEWREPPFRVRDLVPPVFDAYARILHGSRSEGRGRLEASTWARRASELGRELGAETTWWDLQGTVPFGGEPDPSMPDIGRLTKNEATRLVTLLDARIDPAACWFGIWVGWGFLSPSGHAVLRRKSSWLTDPSGRWRAAARARRKEKEMAGLATIELPGRSYYLVGGRVEDAIRFTFDGWFQSPSLWWPEDRSWFVHTEIDAMCTYVGGSRRIIDRLVGQQVLESFEVTEDTLAAL